MNKPAAVLQKFKQVTPRLSVSDVRRTIEFYTQTLGFKVSLLWPEDEPTFLMVERDGVCLAFDVVAGSRKQGANSSCGFYVEVEDVEALHQQIRKLVQIEWGPEVYSYGRREFAIRDPDGYMIIFTEETEETPTCVVE